VPAGSLPLIAVYGLTIDANARAFSRAGAPRLINFFFDKPGSAVQSRGSSLGGMMTVDLIRRMLAAVGAIVVVGGGIAMLRAGATSDLPAQAPRAFIPGVPTVLPAPLKLLKVIPIPGLPVASVDILWADQASERLFLSDRTNAGVDIFDGENDVFVGRVPGFAGATANGGGGPNGVLVTPDNKVWAGDGFSRVQVIDLNLNPPQIVRTITTRGTNRADELAYDPVDHLIMIGNDREQPPFETVISADDYTIRGEIDFRDATGLEQPLWDAQLHRFLLNVPNRLDGGGARVAVVNPTTLSVDANYPVATCSGTGLALGPFQRLLVACGVPFVMNAVNGSMINKITQVNAGDEVWYNAGDGQFYVASTDPATGAGVLGVIDGLTAAWRQNVPAPRARVVSALAANNHVYVLLTATPAGTVDVTPCADAGFKNTGCMAVYAR